MAEITEHHLETKRPLSLLSIAVFWAAGVTMIDLRTGTGVFLCLLSICLTIWLYFGDLKQMSIKNLRRWPVFGIMILIIETFVPGYLMYSKADEGNAGKSSPPITTTGNCATSVGGNNYGQISPDCHTENNYGPPRTIDGIYQDGRKVGSAAFIHPNQDFKTVTIGQIRFIDEPVDFTKPLEIQNGKLLCDGLKNVRTGPSINVLVDVKITCKFVGRR